MPVIPAGSPYPLPTTPDTEQPEAKTMGDEWSELERLAEAATPGDWRAAEIDPVDPEWGAHEIWPVADGEPVSTMVCGKGNAAFIAAANPSTVRKLIAAARTNSVGIAAGDEPSPDPTRAEAVDTACICMKRGHGPEGCGVCNETGRTDFYPPMRGRDRHLVEVDFPNGMRLTIVREDEYDAVTVWSEDDESIFTQAEAPRLSAVGIAPPSTEEGGGLDRIKEALDTYHDALIARQHGGVAADRLVKFVEDFFGQTFDQRRQALARDGGEDGMSGLTWLQERMASNERTRAAWPPSKVWLFDVARKKDAQ